MDKLADEKKNFLYSNILGSNIFKYYINAKQMGAKNKIYTVIKMGYHIYN